MIIAAYQGIFRHTTSASTSATLIYVNTLAGQWTRFSRTFTDNDLRYYLPYQTDFCPISLHRYMPSNHFMGRIHNIDQVSRLLKYSRVVKTKGISTREPAKYVSPDGLSQFVRALVRGKISIRSNILRRINYSACG
jgi:hypothetical protein